MKYLLPCSACGKSIPVEVSQAGHRIHCTCGQALDVPTMRAIRQLPAERSDKPPLRRERTSSWSLLQRLLFVCGLTIATAGLVTAGFFLFARTRVDTSETAWDNIDQSHRAIESLNISDAWDLWMEVRDETIGPYNPPGFIIRRYYSAEWFRISMGGVIALIVGLVFMLSAFVLKPPRSRARN